MGFDPSSLRQWVVSRGSGSDAAALLTKAWELSPLLTSLAMCSLHWPGITPAAWRGGEKYPFQTDLTGPFGPPLAGAEDWQRMWPFFRLASDSCNYPYILALCEGWTKFEGKQYHTSGEESIKKKGVTIAPRDKKLGCTEEKSWQCGTGESICMETPLPVWRAKLGGKK